MAQKVRFENDEPLANGPEQRAYRARADAYNGPIRGDDASAAAPHPRDAAVPAQLLQPSPDATEDTADNEFMEVDHDANMGFIGSLEPSAGDFASELLLQQLGSFGQSYRREARASCTRIISEM